VAERLPSEFEKGDEDMPPPPDCYPPEWDEFTPAGIISHW